LTGLGAELFELGASGEGEVAENATERDASEAREPDPEAGGASEESVLSAGESPPSTGEEAPAGKADSSGLGTGLFLGLSGSWGKQHRPARPLTPRQLRISGGER
jgi:hypothetical protein